jgi:hypothetical protein
MCINDDIDIFDAAHGERCTEGVIDLLGSRRLIAEREQRGEGSALLDFNEWVEEFRSETQVERPRSARSGWRSAKPPLSRETAVVHRCENSCCSTSSWYIAHGGAPRARPVARSTYDAARRPRPLPSGPESVAGMGEYDRPVVLPHVTFVTGCLMNDVTHGADRYV